MKSDVKIKVFVNTHFPSNERTFHVNCSGELSGNEQVTKSEVIERALNKLKIEHVAALSKEITDKSDNVQIIKL